MRNYHKEMKSIADLHIHSRFSRATSKEGDPEHLDLWARKKGISIVGTGDFTHPAWREELAQKLVPAQDGLYILKEELVSESARGFGGAAPRFVISGEISSIYKKNGKTRKVHNVLLLPGLEEAQKLSQKLETIGNIHSDGRPILGLDCRDLLEIMLEICPDGILIPAHIWTPHFSLFGAFSGFDTLEECFEDLTPYIHALETGLSSDPPMNWRLSALDRFQLVSNSDAHSPGKLGREANLLDIEMSYQGLYQAIQEGKGLEGTIEFFPEEGKYHYDGHRNCHLCLSPKESEAYGGKCPVCGRKLTIGVDHRVLQLADREEGYQKKDGKPFESMVPLPEVIGASTGYSAASKKVQAQYEELLKKLGPEFEILREIPVEDIRREGGYLVAEGIRRLREGRVERRPGFDGEYGTVKLFEPGEIQSPDGQMSLFQGIGGLLPEVSDQDGKGIHGGIQEVVQAEAGKERTSALEYAEKERTSALEHTGKKSAQSGHREKSDGLQGMIPSGQAGILAEPVLNPGQQQAAEAVDRAVAVIAGPGTGKTKTLVSRIRYLLENRKVKPSEITAVTFTNKAAGEMKERLEALLGGSRSIRQMHIGTFHSLCLDFLKKQGMEFVLADPGQTQEWAEDIIREYGLDLNARQFLGEVSLWKTGSRENEDFAFKDAVCAYQEILNANMRYDFDDLLVKTLSIFRELPELKKQKLSPLEQPFTYLLVDEFQDISPLQYELIKVWNRHGRELFVIGDPDQSIYGFRGSDAHCFERMREDFPMLRVIPLTENYRCTEKILNSAVEVIRHNPGTERALHACREGGAPVRLAEAPTKMSEAIFAAKEINRLVGGLDMLDTESREIRNQERKLYTFRDIAILYRTHHQARLLEKCLKQEGIPYTVGGREDFLSEPLVRGSISFFRSLITPEDAKYKKDALNLLWKLKEDELADSVYVQLAEKYSTKWKRSKPRKLLEEWMKDLGQEKDPNLQKLAGTAVFYNHMQDFLDALLLGEEGDLRRCGDKTYTADSVSLMTLHGAKGLEFPVVILYGLGKGELPLESEKHPTDIEEERRLFYVGMTRAKEELILTYAQEPSPFLDELPQENVEKERAGKKRAVETAVQMSLFDFL
ncbi:MAG: UvrD-helicase domain-containing protein [Eubacteriales bacterium]|nr:UvrD-helicase domain-containing protein [Eubacteriales bacterium]